MKILVTGCAGFIGSNLCEYLLSQGHHVIGIDKDTSKEAKRRLENIEPILNMIMYWEDIMDIDNIMSSHSKPDIVYHLAAASDIMKSSTDMEWDMRENVIGTHKVLEYIRKSKIKKLVYSSTSVVQGEDVPKPTPESGIDFNPGSLYAASKCAAECYIRAYAKLYDIKSWIFRFGNVIGKNEHRGVIFDFIHKLRKNPNQLEILGNGRQIKSYIHVSDVVSAITSIPNNTDIKKVDVFNLGLKEWKSVTELANYVCDELGLKPDYTYTGGDRGWAGDIPVVMLETDKALATGWKPKLSCEEAIRQTVRELNE